MIKRASFSLTDGDSERLDIMTRRLGVPELAITAAACRTALHLMEAGEYRPPSGGDITRSIARVKGHMEVRKKLTYLCLISDLRYTAGNGKSRHITASKVIRDVLHCMLNLHEAGVQLNLEVGNGK